MVDLPAEIRLARTSSGLSQTEVASRAGCSLHAVWEIERGNGTVQLLDRVMTALGMRIAGLPRGSSLGERIRKLRLRRGWSQEKLASRAGVSAMAVGRLESGNARMKTLAAVIEVLAPSTAKIAENAGDQYKKGSKDFRFTPRDVLDRIHAVIGTIDLDPAADRDALVVARRFFYAEEDGLTQPWQGDTVFCNPPYSRTTAFIRKAHRSWRDRECRVILMLLPVRTEIHAFHDCLVGTADIFFLRGAIAFERPSGDRAKAPFGSMIVIYGSNERMIERVLDQFDCVHLPRNAGVSRLGGIQEIERAAAE
jgi:phage N-6-adenine-methyltransferase